jgi:Zn-dependent protease with chaperone function
MNTLLHPRSSGRTPAGRGARGSISWKWLGGWLAAAAMSSAVAAEPQPAADAASAVRGLFERLLGTKEPAPTGAGIAASSPAPSLKNGRSSETLVASALARSDLAVDRQCKQVIEDTDVFAKAARYAGKAGALRLQRLIASDFKHDDLTDSDLRMLRYLAYTTIWIPASMEAELGQMYAKVQGGGAMGGGAKRAALERLRARMGEMVGGIGPFPGEPTLMLDDDLPDGAFARAGGLVVVSPRFLSLMDETDDVRDVVLAHELSHLYKRHALKELQHQLVTNAAGFSVAKKLIGRSQSSPSGNSLAAWFTTGRTLVELLDWIRSNQIRYSKDQELEADACSLNWLKPLRVEPRRAWKAFGSVLVDAPADPASSYSSLHPSPEERKKNIEQAMGRATAPRPASSPRR